MYHEDQETLIGDILNLQATIGRGERDEKIEDSVGIICEGIRMEKHITIQNSLLYIQAKEGMYKINYRDLSETAVIKAELQSTMDMVKKIDQYQRRPMQSLKK